MLKKSAIAAAFLLAACGYPSENAPAPTRPGEVTLTATPPETSAGSTMVLRLANGSRQAIGYNLCTSALLDASGNAVKTDRVCTMELRTLAPAGAANYDYDLPADLPSGSYRFSTDLERMQSGDRTTVTSNTFDVR